MRVIFFRRVGVMLLCAAFWTALSVPASAQSALSTAQYLRALVPVQAAAASAAAGDPAAATRCMDAIKPLARCTVLSGHDLVFVDNRSILADMQAAQLQTSKTLQNAAWAAIARQLASMQDSISSSDVKRQLAAVKQATAVLSTAEFSSQPLPGKSGWERFGDWLEKELAKIHIHFPHWHWPHMATPGAISPVIPEIILAVLVIAAVGLLVTLIVLWWRNRIANFVIDSDARSDLALTLQERELVAAHNYAGLRALAADAAQRADYRAAFRLIFLAVLVLLDAEGAIKLNRSKTNWEYLRALTTETDLRARLTPLVHDFDRVWYGEAAAEESDYTRANSEFDAIQTSLNGSVPPQTKIPAQVGSA